jgi:hypothetical protein
VQLSALGIAIAPMVTVAEILKSRGLAVEKKISTALESLSDDYRCGAHHACSPAWGRKAGPGAEGGACDACAGRGRSPTWRSCC